MEVTKLFSKIYNQKIDVEFSCDEVDSINQYIRTNDVESIIQLFELKEAIGQDVFRDMIYSNTDSVLHSIMDNIHQPVNIYSVSDYEKNAIMFSEFDYKIKHDELKKWAEGDDCNILFDIDLIYDFVNDSTFANKDKFLEIIDVMSKVERSIHNLNHNNLWYEEDKETRLNSLKKCKQQYLDIEKDWNEYFEEYLLNNIPDNYLSIIIHSDMPKGI